MGQGAPRQVFALEALAAPLRRVNPPDAPAQSPAADSRPHGSPVPAPTLTRLCQRSSIPTRVDAWLPPRRRYAVIHSTSSLRSPGRRLQQDSYVSMGRTPGDERRRHIIIPVSVASRSSSMARFISSQSYYQLGGSERRVHQISEALWCLFPSRFARSLHEQQYPVADRCHRCAARCAMMPVRTSTVTPAQCTDVEVHVVTPPSDLPDQTYAWDRG